MKLNFETNIAEGTPEELVEYLRLVEEGNKDNQLISFGHAHQPGEDTLKSLVGSSKEDDSYTYSTEILTEEEDLGEFYIVNDFNRALSIGTILKKVDKHTLKDSLGDEYLHVNVNAVEPIEEQLYDLEDRFSFATQVGVRLRDTTDLARATEGDYFKVPDSYEDLMVGDTVTIAKDDRDNQPQCKDKYGNFCYVYLGHLELIQEPTESSIEEEDVEVEPPTELQVGDRVRVLESEGGAMGEATVTKVIGDGGVKLEGKSESGTYSNKWSNHVSNLEKIESSTEEGEDNLMGYTFWYLEGTTFNEFVVLKATFGGYFVDSGGSRYSYQAVSGYAKPIDREDVREEFEEVEHEGGLLKYYPTLDMFDKED